jgi:hypothetical protein
VKTNADKGTSGDHENEGGIYSLRTVQHVCTSNDVVQYSIYHINSKLNSLLTHLGRQQMAQVHNP